MTKFASVLTTPLVIIIAGVIAGTAATARADFTRYVWRAPEKSRNSLTVSSAWPLRDEVTTEVEVSMRDRLAIVSGFVTRTDLEPAGETLAVFVQGGARFFPVGRGPEGLWICPLIAAGVTSASFETGLERRGPAVRASLTAGGTWMPIGRLIVSASGGFSYDRTIVRAGRLQLGEAGFLPQLRATVGFAF